MGFDLKGKSGNEFHANCWSWRPIHALVERLNVDCSLGLNLHGWAYNDGEGLHTEADCIKLAEVLEKAVKEGPDVWYLQTDRCAIDGKGRFLPEGQKGLTPYYTTAEHITEFVKFLRECGGSFEIW